MIETVLVGAGGHARSILAAALGGPLTFAACTDPDINLHGREVLGVPIVGDDDQLPRLLREGITAAVVGLGAVGDNTARARIFDHLAALGFSLPAVISPHAIVADRSAIADGAVVLAGAIVGPGAIVGRNTIINTGAIVEHDCRLGDHTHIASGAILGGAVVTGRGAHVGLGASVRQGARLGAGCLVGAGAVVVADVADGTTVVGCPARPRGL